MTATSFGLYDPTDVGLPSGEDFVDLTHLKHVVHVGFSLSYPAAWFLRIQGNEEDQGTELHNFFA